MTANCQNPCIICDCQDTKVLFSINNHNIVQCCKCSLAYLDTRYEDDVIKSVYQSDYFSSPAAHQKGYANYFLQKSNYERTFEKRIKLVEKFRRNGDLIDIGSACGFFVGVALNRGWNPLGVDISRQAVDFAHEKLGLTNIECIDFTRDFDSETNKNKFDVVTMWDYIEHSVDPNTDLLKTHDILKDDGILVMETQNVRSLAARLFGKRWWHFTKCQEHLYHFSPDTIRLLLNKNGFEVIHITKKYCGKYIDLDFFIERSVLWGSLVNKAIEMILRPIRTLSLYINPFDEIIVVARKTHMPLS